jgi:hypothetical protein
MTDEEIAAAAAAQAEKDTADALAATEAAAAAAALEAGKRTKVSDNEAALLKETMKHKAAATAAKAEAAAALARLHEFDGLDSAELRKLLAEKAKADENEALKRGEYDRIIAQVRTDAKTREDALTAENETTKGALTAAQRRIDDLTVGHSFAGSKFLSEDTVLSGEKARRLYGDHFEIEDGDLVAYDKPAGAKERTPLVDSRGEKLDFEAAIAKILKADPDFERIAKSKLKTGTMSIPSTTDKDGRKIVIPPAAGRAQIASVLRAKQAARK